MFNLKETREQLAHAGYLSPSLRISDYDGREEKPTPEELLLQERIIFVWSVISDRVAENIIMQLLYLQSEDTTRDITLYINSPGGDINAGLAVYDTMQFVKADIATYCVGIASGIAVALLASGAKGKRFCLPHAQVVFEQTHDTVEGGARDLAIEAREAMRQQQLYCEILAKHTGKTTEEVWQSSDHLHYMTAQQAVEYGLVDEMITY